MILQNISLFAAISYVVANNAWRSLWSFCDDKFKQSNVKDNTG